MKSFITLCLLFVLTNCWIWVACAESEQGDKIHHGSEYYVKYEQHKDEWNSEYEEIDKKLPENMTSVKW